MPYGDGLCYSHWNIIVMASATIEFATRMGSLFRQQVRALEKEKLIFGEPHANSNECSAGNEFSGRSFQICNLLGFCNCVTNLLNVISKMQGLWWAQALHFLNYIEKESHTIAETQYIAKPTICVLLRMVSEVSTG